MYVRKNNVNILDQEFNITYYKEAIYFFTPEIY